MRLASGILRGIVTLVFATSTLASARGAGESVKPRSSDTIHNTLLDFVTSQVPEIDRSDFSSKYTLSHVREKFRGVTVHGSHAVLAKTGYRIEWDFDSDSLQVTRMEVAFLDSTALPPSPKIGALEKAIFQHFETELQPGKFRHVSSADRRLTVPSGVSGTEFTVYLPVSDKAPLRIHSVIATMSRPK